MDTQTVSKERRTPTIFNDLFKPWDEWFDNGIWFKTMNIPSVNIKEEKDHFIVSLAAPGLKRNDFKIKVDENLLTISSEKEHEEKEEDENYTRKEFSYESFTRSLSLPDEIKKDKIDAKYEDGILKITLPRTEQAKKHLEQFIPVK